MISTASNTVIATIPVGASPFGIEFDSTNDRMYVANIGTLTVSVIQIFPSTPTLKSTLPSTPSTTPSSLNSST